MWPVHRCLDPASILRIHLSLDGFQVVSMSPATSLFILCSTFTTLGLINQLKYTIVHLSLHNILLYQLNAYLSASRL